LPIFAEALFLSLPRPNTPSVLLDGKICEEGDTVRGRRVLKIARDNVTVEYLGQISVLKMVQYHAGVNPHFLN